MSSAGCHCCVCGAGDTKGIDDVIERVQLIVEPVETVMFDVFEQAHAPQWRALRTRFFADNEEVKAATRELIDTSFRKLRSAEGAFDLLQVRVHDGSCMQAQDGQVDGSVDLQARPEGLQHADPFCLCSMGPAAHPYPCGWWLLAVQNFKSIKSRGAIQQQMMNKLVDTLEQFLREIIAAQEMFDRCKANPPLTRNQPPVAGGLLQMLHTQHAD
jgi:dynein heavy chain